MKTGSGHESLSTCDILSIHHFQYICQAESGPRTDYKHKITEWKKHDQMSEPPETSGKSFCVVLHFSPKQSLLIATKMVAIFFTDYIRLHPYMMLSMNV